MAENDADPPPPGLQSAGIAVPLLEAAHAAQTGLLREKGWEVDGNFLRVSVPKLKAAVKARRQARQKEARRIAARDRMRANRAAAGKEGRAAEALKRKARRAAAGADGRAKEALRRKAHRAAAGAAGKASERERDALRHAKKRVLEHAWRHEARRITDKEELEDRIILWRAKEEGYKQEWLRRHRLSFIWDAARRASAAAGVPWRERIPAWRSDTDQDAVAHSQDEWYVNTWYPALAGVSVEYQARGGPWRVQGEVETVDLQLAYAAWYERIKQKLTVPVELYHTHRGMSTITERVGGPRISYAVYRQRKYGTPHLNPQWVWYRKYGRNT